MFVFKVSDRAAQADTLSAALGNLDFGLLNFWPIIKRGGGCLTSDGSALDALCAGGRG